MGGSGYEFVLERVEEVSTDSLEGAAQALEDWCFDWIERSAHRGDEFAELLVDYISSRLVTRIPERRSSSS